jgi:hypothetical protein
MDTSPLINNYEDEYLNFVINTSLQDFDLTGKQIGFLFAGR